MPRKTTRTSRKGAGLKDLLKKGHDYVKDKKLISRVISELGYGAPKRKRKAPTRKGGFFGSLIGAVARPIGHWAVDKITGGRRMGGSQQSHTYGLGISGHRGGSRVMMLGNVYDPAPRGAILA